LWFLSQVAEIKLAFEINITTRFTGLIFNNCCCCCSVWLVVPIDFRQRFLAYREVHHVQTCTTMAKVIHPSSAIDDQPCGRRRGNTPPRPTCTASNRSVIQNAQIACLCWHFYTDLSTIHPFVLVIVLLKQHASARKTFLLVNVTER